MEPTTLCFPINERNEILLGMKKRGFGAHKYNGFGGKIKPYETFRQCAVRELFEEVSLLAREEDLIPVGYIDFRFPYEPTLTHIGYVYFLWRFKGVPLESEEMKPSWFSLESIPYDQMWAGDRTWLPPLLGKKRLVGHVTFGPDNETVESMEFKEVDVIDDRVD